MVAVLSLGAAAPIALGWRMPLEKSAVEGRLLAGVDPNEAEWYELAQLPGVGEMLARRIVEVRREAAGRQTPGGRVFERPGDLLRVKGIGPRVLKRLGPFLRWEDGHGAGAAVDRADAGG